MNVSNVRVIVTTVEYSSQASFEQRHGIAFEKHRGGKFMPMLDGVRQKQISGKALWMNTVVLDSMVG